MTPLLPVRPRDVVRAARDLGRKASSRPLNLLNAIGQLANDQAEILRGRSEIVPLQKSRRFRDNRWSDHRYYRSVLQSWLALQRRSKEWLKASDLDEISARRADFFLDIMLGSLSPANYAATNPEVVDTTIATRGRNLLQGMRRRWQDMRDNDGLPTQVDKRAYQVGKNLATSPGQVVYRSELFELIQYAPATKQVYRLPLLLVSSYINRPYLLDLKPGRSLVEQMVAQGHVVFLIAWRNPGTEQRHWGYTNYAEAIIEAAAAIRKIRRSSSLNLLGLCAGGVIATLAACVLEARKKPWINTLTLLVNVLDTRPDDTDMGLVCTEQAVKSAKKQVKKQGLFRAEDLLWSFNLMQPESLIWNTWVDYYLLGKEPPSSEVMFWMNDQVNLPEKLYSEQLDIMLHNPLPKAGEFPLLDVPVDLKRLTMDCYLVGAYYDHIMPWRAVYRSRALLGGSTEFVLTNGGHITPCITTLDNPRSRYFTGGGTPASHDAWLENAREHTGAWQSHWASWLKSRSGKRVPAPKKPGNTHYQPLAAAPGTYVHQ